MPPALSDDEELSSNERIPAQRKGKQPLQNQAHHEDDADDDDEDADEYVVEKVMAHKFVKGKLVFDVKWQGYDDPKDRTWEPEENMDGAIDVMNEYFDEIGGRPEAPGPKRKARASGISKSESAKGTPASTKRVKHEKEWSPPPGSWEHDVSYVDTIEESTDPRTGELGRFAYLVWNNDKKTQHPLKHVNHKCPQKMLQYYESHLVFTQNDGVNGGGGSDPTMNDVH